MFKENKTESLSHSDFRKLSSFIHREIGIKMPETKKIMVEARLRKRLRELDMNSYEEYCKYTFSKEGHNNELINMVDVITTNKTDFFREPRQFKFLSEESLPELLKTAGSGNRRPLNVWSAGCSSGEEPYTLAMVLNEFAENFSKYNYNILATDISTHVLEKASVAIYDENRIAPVPTDLAKKYFMRSKDKQKKLVRVIPELRKTIYFKWLNFMDQDYGINESFDIIFCRNVIIYFDKDTQDKLIAKLVSYLNTGGYLFLGHSESIFNTDLPLVQLAASTYRKIK